MIRKYPITASEDSCQFRFQSVSVNSDGTKRIINKLVEFEKPPLLLDDGTVINAFNMFLADELSDGSFSDSVRSNNGDLEKVLATIGNCVVEFFKHHPDAVVHFKGGDKARNRLYRRELSKRENFELISKVVETYGISEDKGIFAYEPNAVCEAFLLRMKK